MANSPGVSCPMFCKTSDEQEGVLHWGAELRNGQVAAVLTAAVSCCSCQSFNLEEGEQSLRDKGVSVAELGAALQGALWLPEVRRYLLLTSRQAHTALALVCYVCLWLNLYCSLRAVGIATHWSVGVWVSLTSMMGTAGGLLALHWHSTQLNMNTDLRLAGLNEMLQRRHLLAGLTQCTGSQSTVLRLWLVHFDLSPCRQALSQLLEHWSSCRQSELQQRLDQLCVVVSDSLGQSEEERGAGLTEEVPLLGSVSGGGMTRQLSITQRVRLIPNGTPQDVSEALLLCWSALYTRLLVQGRLPPSPSSPHHAAPYLPCCPCQLVQSTLLGNTMLCCLG
ncbi:transmembrane protein 268 isoform X2 [Amia ocellicauda]|uniref:transmembrane protein 268 isoform X2 n=1 Tax=Amia ocellicauda TaxID=2972642 RepID=UPI003464609B